MAAGVSDRFKEVIRGSYQLAAKVEVTDDQGRVLADTVGLDVIGGRVNAEAQAVIRRWVDLTVVDRTGALIPETVADIFSPVASNELKVYVGVVVDGVPDYVLQGVFFLEGATTMDTPEGLTITLTAYDRARRFQRAKLTVPVRFRAVDSVPIYQAITDLLQISYPGLVVYHDEPSWLTPDQDYLQSSEPWAIGRELAESMGYELFFDRIGDCHLRKIPDPNDRNLALNWSYAEGVDSALLDVRREQANTEAYNGIWIEGSNAGLTGAVRVLLWDDDPASPTYYLGKYGRVPDFWQTDKVRTVEQATEAARGRLNQRKGITETVAFTITPNPALEPNDVVQLVRARSKLDSSDPGFIVDGFSVPLTSQDGPMTVTCRQRRL